MYRSLFLAPVEWVLLRIFSHFLFLQVQENFKELRKHTFDRCQNVTGRLIRIRIPINFLICILINCYL